MSGLIDLSSDTDNETKPIIPPWTLWKKRMSSEKKEAWLRDMLPIIEKSAEARISTYVNNLLWYTGEYEKTLEYRLVIPGRGDQVLPRRVLPRIFNHLFDITEQRVSRLSRFKPNFDVVPTNREETDRIVAKLLKVCMDNVARRVKIDYLMQEIERWCAVFGEVLVGIEWNNYIGDRISRGSVERVGDVDVYIKDPWTYFPEPKRRWQDVNWCVDIWDIIHVEEARVVFDKSDLEPDKKKNVFSFNESLIEKREDEVVIRRLIQKPSQFLPEGAVTWFAGEKLVREEEVYPYSHNDFPWERHTDIDVPSRLFPISVYQHLMPVQHVYNRLTSIMVRNLLLTGNPHLLNPIGSGAKREAFGNGPTEIKYRPINGLKPELLTFKGVPQEFFQFRDGVKQELGEVAGTQNALRGNPPAGTRAASMLRWFEEQQEQRMSTTILKHNDLIQRLFYKVGSIIGDYYPVEDKQGGNRKRLLRVVGPDNQYLIEDFNAAKISSEYDVIILNSTGFSQMMSGRLEEIALITQIEKDTGQIILSPQEKADILEAKNPQKAYDILTSSLKSAEMYNEYFMSGKPVPEPQQYWDLITHWRTLVIMMNAPQWERVPQEKREPAEEHLTILEDLMERKAKANVTFAQKLSLLEGYPCFWNLEPAAPQMPQTGMQEAAGAPPETKPGMGPAPKEPGINPADLSNVPMPPPPQGPGAVQ